MSKGCRDEWEYQIRIKLDLQRAELARVNPHDIQLTPMSDILKRHQAKLVCQYDAFVEYCESAEKSGVERYPLYRWTKDTIENPEKRAKYLRAFTFYIANSQVYAKDKAESLELELKPLVKSGLIEELFKHDTNPANNPQPPKRFLNG